jgi:hypothetical protein
MIMTLIKYILTCNNKLVYSPDTVAFGLSMLLVYTFYGGLGEQDPLLPLDLDLASGCLPLSDRVFCSLYPEIRRGSDNISLSSDLIFSSTA